MGMKESYLDKNYDRRFSRFLKEFEWYVSSFFKTERVWNTLLIMPSIGSYLELLCNIFTV